MTNNGYSTYKCFNPRAHEGRDFWPRMTTRSSNCFNPRAHEGRDKRKSNLTYYNLCFNPRAHEGRDGLTALKKG